MIMQLIKNSKSIKIGNVTTYRDYTFVEDLCKAYWLLSKSNLGYGKVLMLDQTKHIK